VQLIAEASIDRREYIAAVHPRRNPPHYAMAPVRRSALKETLHNGVGAGAPRGKFVRARPATTQKQPWPEESDRENRVDTIRLPFAWRAMRPQRQATASASPQHEAKAIDIRVTRITDVTLRRRRLAPPEQTECIG